MGGSAITFKDRPFSLREEEIRKISRALRAADKSYFLIHGGGSWGHPIAMIYNLSSFNYSQNAKGATYTKIKMQQLSSLVQKLLMEEGIFTFYYPAQSISSLNVNEIYQMMDLKVYPLTYGDVIYETNKGFRVIGGDEIILKLSSKIKPEKVVFIMATPGILDESGNIIDKISVKKSGDGVYINDVPIISGNVTFKFKEILPKVSKMSPDATGGMAYKLYIAKILAKRGIKTVFVGPESTENLVNALKGYKFAGSLVI